MSIPNLFSPLYSGEVGNIDIESIVSQSLQKKKKQKTEEEETFMPLDYMNWTSKSMY